MDIGAITTRIAQATRFQETRIARIKYSGSHDFKDLDQAKRLGPTIVNRLFKTKEASILELVTAFMQPRKYSQKPIPEQLRAEVQQALQNPESNISKMVRAARFCEERAMRVNLAVSKLVTLDPTNSPKDRARANIHVPSINDKIRNQKYYQMKELLYSLGPSPRKYKD